MHRAIYSKHAMKLAIAKIGAFSVSDMYRVYVRSVESAAGSASHEQSIRGTAQCRCAARLSCKLGFRV